MSDIKTVAAYVESLTTYPGIYTESEAVDALIASHKRLRAANNTRWRWYLASCWRRWILKLLKYPG